MFNRLNRKISTFGRSFSIISAESNTPHISVLPSETIDVWIQHDLKNFHYVDGTTGFGGHSELLLKSHDTAKLLCIDRDPETLHKAEKRLSAYKDRVQFVQGSYVDIETHLKTAGFPTKVAGILLDLGANSYQFDEGSRGFSFFNEGPLDMRYNQHDDSIQTAYHIVNNASEVELTNMFKNYGEEKYSKEAAKAIVRRRNRGLSPIQTTHELRDCLDIVLSKWKNKDKKNKTHSATKCFQALRIAVNNELDHLEEGIMNCIKCLDHGGRLATISFHSLEDRPIKKIFRKLVQKGHEKSQYQQVIRNCIKPSMDEIQINNRSRSAKLRCIEAV